MTNLPEPRMVEGHIHHAVAGDGTDIRGRVHGHGPPLVFVHGGAGDGESSWRFLVPLLLDQFTCHTMSTRGRGLSADHPDHSIDAIVGDVAAYADSIGQPVGVVGHSSSLALAAAARTDAIGAVAVHEPAVSAFLLDDPRPEDAIERLFDAAAQGRPADAVRIFFEESGLFNDDEVAGIAASGTYDRLAANVPAWTAEMGEYAGAVQPEILEQVTVPVLLLRGTQTAPCFDASVQHVAEHLPDVRIGDVPGAGHMGPLVMPEPIAGELRDHFVDRIPSPE